MDQEEPVPLDVRRLFVLFVATLFLYVTVYGACTAAKRRGGPWALIFNTTNGTPSLTISHQRHLSQPVTLLFPNESPERTDLPIVAVYSVPITNRMPFGPVLHVDTTSLPGVVTLNCFGHAVEILPRTLLIDFQEYPWVPGTNIIVLASNKPPAEKLKPRNLKPRGF